MNTNPEYPLADVLQELSDINDGPEDILWSTLIVRQKHVRNLTVEQFLRQTLRRAQEERSPIQLTLDQAGSTGELLANFYCESCIEQTAPGEARDTGLPYDACHNWEACPVYRSLKALQWDPGWESAFPDVPSCPYVTKHLG